MNVDPRRDAILALTNHLNALLRVGDTVGVIRKLSDKEKARTGLTEANVEVIEVFRIDLEAGLLVFNPTAITFTLIETSDPYAVI